MKKLLWFALLTCTELEKEGQSAGSWMQGRPVGWGGGKREEEGCISLKVLALRGPLI